MYKITACSYEFSTHFKFSARIITLKAGISQKLSTFLASSSMELSNLFLGKRNNKTIASYQ